MLTRRETLGVLAAGALAAADHPVRKPKIELLWKSPDPHPNALAETQEGLWVGDQITDNAHLLDWETGRVIRKVPTESSNTSGLAYGGGFLWMAANGPAKPLPFGREARPTDAKSGEVIKADPMTGKTIARYPVPGGGGVHGITWVENSLWITTLKLKSLTQVDVNFKILRSIPVTLDRAHGFVWDKGTIWCMFSDDYVIQRLDAKDGRILEEVQLTRGVDPDPHGMTLHKGVFYYSDAGMLVGLKGASGSKYAGYICKFRLG